MTKPRLDSDLRTYVLKTFIPQKIGDCSRRYAYQFHTAVSALSRAIGRRPRISDLTAENIEWTYTDALRRDCSRETAKLYQQRLWQVRRFLFPEADRQAETATPDLKWKGRTLTLAKAFELIYRPFIEATVAERTIVDYRAALRAWDRCGAPRRDVRHLTASDFMRFVQTYERDHAPASVNSKLRQFRAILRFLSSEGILDRQVQIRPVRVPEVVKPRPTFEQVGVLYRACTEADITWRWPEWWQTFIVLAYVGALRVSELLALRWEHIKEDGIELHRPKTARFTFVPMLPVVRDHIERMRAVVADLDSRVLPCAAGHRQFYDEVRRIGAAAEMQWTPHGLRRAAVDNWTRTDMLAGKIIGHSTLDVAFRCYLDKRQYVRDVAPKLAIPPVMLEG